MDTCRKLKKGTTIAGQVHKGAPLYCEVKIVCDGKEVTTVDPTPPLSPSPVNNNSSSSRSNNPTPPSSTPNHDTTAANGDRKDRERRKITKFLRCFSLWICAHIPASLIYLLRASTFVCIVIGHRNFVINIFTNVFVTRSSWFLV